MLLPLLALAAVQAPAGAPSEARPDHPVVYWFSDSDYPAVAVQREASGTVGWRLAIGADGVPTGCIITSPADPDLDQATCRILMSRAHFSPARDRDGRPVAGSFAGRIRWVLPPAQEGPPPFVAVHVATMEARDANGNITCSISVNGAGFMPRSSGECGFLAGSGAEAALRSPGTPDALILTYVSTPEGTAPAPGNEEMGSSLVYEDTARLVIASDGTLTACGPGGTPILRTHLPLRFPPTCPLIGAQVTVPVTDQAPRRAFIAIRIYTRSPAVRH
jgi:hypothetical protein